MMLQAISIATSICAASSEIPILLYTLYQCNTDIPGEQCALIRIIQNIGNIDLIQYLTGVHKHEVTILTL